MSLARGLSIIVHAAGGTSALPRRRCNGQSELPVGCLLSGAAINVVAFFRNPASRSMSAALAAAFCGLPTFWIASARYHLGRIRDTEKTSSLEPAPSLTSLSRAAQGISLPAPLFEERSGALAALRRPRRLKLSWQGRFYTLIAVAGGPFSLYLAATWMREGPRAAGSAQSQTLPWFLVCSAFCFYLFTFILNRLRELKLHTDGAVANGYVVSQKTNRYPQNIADRFQDAAGRAFTARCTDPSRSLYEGMNTPVFYDVNQPTQSIPPECSLTKLATR
jgi:hypothetical protein